MRGEFGAKPRIFVDKIFVRFSWADGPDTLEKRVTLSFKSEVTFVKMPPPFVPKLLMSVRRFN